MRLCHCCSPATLCRPAPAQLLSAAAAAAESAGEPTSPLVSDGALSPITPGPVTPTAEEEAASVSVVTSHDAALPPLSTTELAHAWESSALFREVHAYESDQPLLEPLALASPFAQAQYGTRHARALGPLALTLLSRQWKLTMRNTMYVWGRAFSSIIVSIILGTVRG